MIRAVLNTFFLFFFIGNYSYAITNVEKRKIIEEIAEEFSNSGKTFYRWQSRASGDNLLKNKEYTKKLHDYFMGMKIDRYHFAAGHGVYVSENPHSASEFIRGTDDGSLIVVEVSSKQKYIDLTNQSVLKKLSKHGISKDDVLFNTNPNVLVKYNKDHKWWVVKGRQGVQFKPFTGQGLKTGYLQNIYSKLEGGDKAKRIFRNSIRDDFVKRVKQDINLIDSDFVSSLFNDNVFKHIIHTHLKRQYSSAKEDRLIQKLASSERVRKLFKEGKIDLDLIQNKKFSSFIKFSVLLPESNLEKVLSSVDHKKILPDDYIQILKLLKGTIRNERSYEERLKADEIVQKFKENLSFSDATSVKKKRIEIAEKALLLSKKEISDLKKLKEHKLKVDEDLKKFKKINSVSTLMEAKRKSLGNVKTVRDFLRVAEHSVKNPSDDYKTATNKFIQENIKKFIALDPNPSEVMRLKRIASSVETIKVILNQSLPLASTATEFNDMMKYSVNSPSDDYKKGVSSVAEQFSDFYARLKPSAKDLIELEKLLNYTNGLQAVLDSSLKKMSSASDFAKVAAHFQKGAYTDGYKEAIGKIIVANLNSFEKLRPTVNDYITLRKGSRYINESMIIFDNGVKKAKTPDQFVRFVNSFYLSGGKDEYKEKLSNKLLKHINILEQLSPDVEHFKAIKKVSNQISINIDLLNKGKKYAKTPKEFIELFEAYNISGANDEYKAALQKFLTSSIDDFLKLNPNIDDLKKLERSVTSVEGNIKFMTKGLSLVKKPEDYLKLVEFVRKSPSDKYKQEMSSFRKKHNLKHLTSRLTNVDIFREMNSTKQIEAYKKIVQLKDTYQGSLSLDELDALATSDSIDKDVKKIFINNSSLAQMEVVSVEDIPKLSRLSSLEMSTSTYFDDLKKKAIFSHAQKYKQGLIDIEEVLDIDEKLYYNKNKIHFRSILLPNVRTIKDYEKLVKYKGKDGKDYYNKELAKLVEANIDVLISLNPNDSKIASILFEFSKNTSDKKAVERVIGRVLERINNKGGFSKLFTAIFKRFNGEFNEYLTEVFEKNRLDKFSFEERLQILKLNSMENASFSKMLESEIKTTKNSNQLLRTIEAVGNEKILSRAIKVNVEHVSKLYFSFDDVEDILSRNLIPRDTHKKIATRMLPEVSSEEDLKKLKLKGLWRLSFDKSYKTALKEAKEKINYNNSKAISCLKANLKKNGVNGVFKD